MNNPKPSPQDFDMKEEVSEQCFSQETQDLCQLVLDASTDDLFELAKIAGLDPLTDYAGGDLRNADLMGKELSGADLSNTDLRGANLSDANLSGVDLSNADLSGANLSGANLSGANLSGANLSSANLSETLMIRAFLMGANLSQVCLYQATLIRSNFSKTDLSGANLESSNLQEANVTSADLNNANLSHANLNHTDLRHSTLKGANLVKTDLASASVEGARFSENQGLSEEAKLDLKDRKAILTYDIREILLAWDELDENDREWMIQTGQSQEIPDGTKLIQENGSIAALYIVLRGELTVSAAGMQSIATLSSGEVVGEMSFVRNLPPSATVEAIQNSYVWVLHRKALTEKLDQDHAFGCRFYKALTVVLSNRLKRTTLELIQKDQPVQILMKDQQLQSISDNPSLASLLINGDKDIRNEITTGSQSSTQCIAPSS